MKLAVLADIHANLAALEAVLADLDAWQPDAVVVAGDVVNRGPQPLACLDRVLSRVERDGWRVVRGNHEDFVLREGGAHIDRPAWEAEVCRHSGWTREQIGDRAEAIAAWPDLEEMEGPGGGRVRCVHGSMRGNRHGLYPSMSDDVLASLIAPPPAVLCAGHTHVPFVRRVGETLVVNAGAVGLPFDGDPRAAYARLALENGNSSAEVVRVAYDREATAAAFRSSGYRDDGGPMVSLIFDELQCARPRLRKWHDTYEAEVAAGRLTVEDSVRRQLLAHAEAGDVVTGPTDD
jgi:putative phosphoesterase